MKKLLFLYLAVCSLAFTQAVRLDPTPIMTTAANVPPGAMAPVLAIPGSKVHVCQYPANGASGVPCTNYATTYTDPTENTACPTNAQIVLAGTTTCVSTTDAQGNYGFWVAPGPIYTYTVTIPQGTTFGPYEFTPIVQGTTGAIIYNEGSTGAVNRTVTSRLQDFISAKDFGVVADGTTDNTAAINAAIAAAASGPTRTDVVLPGGSGAYAIAGTINMQSGVSLRCLNGSTQIKYTGSGTGILFDGVTHSYLKGCSVITTSTASTVRAIQFLATSADTKWNGVSDVIVTSASPGATIAGQYGIDMDDETSHALYWNDFRNVTMIGWDYAFHLIGNSTTHEGPNSNFFHGINTNSSHFGIYFGLDVAENTVSSLFCNGGGYSGASAQVCVYMGGTDASNYTSSNQVVFHSDQGSSAFAYLLDTYSLWNVLWVDNESGQAPQNSGNTNQVFSPNLPGNFLPTVTSTTSTVTTLKPSTVITQGAKPTFALLSGSGTGATITILNTATNGGGRFCVTSGTSPVVNQYIVQITWAGAPYSIVPEVMIQPANTNAGSLGASYLFYDSMGSDATDAFFRLPTGATLTASTQYCWQYTTIQ